MDDLHAPARGDLENAVRFLRRRGIWVVLCAVIAGGAAVAWSKTRTKSYTASAVLLFETSQIPNELFGSTVVDPNDDPTRDAATDLQLVGLGVIAGRTAQALKGNWTAGEVASKVQAQGGGEANTVTVSATDPSPAFAAKLANTFASQFVSFRRSEDRSSLLGALGVVDAQLAAPGLSPGQASDLQSRAEQLRILAALQTGGVELVQRAGTPTSPSSPIVTQNALIGIGLGVLLGLTVALLLQRFDRRVRDVDELKEAYGLPLLGVIPKSRALRREGELPPLEAQAFQMLRTTVRYAKGDRTLRSVLVASASPSEGKSTVSWNLAVAAATARSPGGGSSASSRVLLIEADFHRPSLAAAHGLRPTPGLCDLITDDLPLSKVVQSVPVGPDASESGPMLDVIPAGISHSPSGLLQSSASTELLAMLTGLYGFVVIDTPPSTVIADAIPLMKRVGGVVVVGRIGVTRRDAARRLVDQLKQIEARVIGVVANDVAANAQGYGYYTHYSGYTSESNGDRAGDREQAGSELPVGRG